MGHFEVFGLLGAQEVICLLPKSLSEHKVVLILYLDSISADKRHELHLFNVGHAFRHHKFG